MKAVRLWSIRIAGWLKKCFAAFEGVLARFNPLLKAIGHERLDKPFAALEGAEWIRKSVAGVHIPDDVIKRLAGAEDQKQEGVDLWVDLIEQVQEIEGISGVHIMAYRMEDRIGEIVTRFNALGGREPWRPAA